MRPATCLPILGAALVLIAGPFPAAAAAADLPLPADRTWVLEADLRQMEDHGLGLIADAIDTLPIAEHLQSIAHFQVSRDLHSIIATGTADPASGLAYCRGSFDVDALYQLAELAPGHAQATFHGHRLDSWDGAERTGWGCIVDAHLVLLAREQAPLELALDTLDGRAPALGATAQLAMLEPNAAGALLRGAALVAGGLPTQHGHSALVRHLQTLSLVVQPSGDGLGGVLTGTTIDAATAGRMLRLLQGLQAMHELSPSSSEHPLVQAVLDTLTLVSSGNTLTATWTISGKALAQGVAKAQHALSLRAQAPSPTRSP